MSSKHEKMQNRHKANSVPRYKVSCNKSYTNADNMHQSIHIKNNFISNIITFVCIEYSYLDLESELLMTTKLTV